MTTAQQPLTEFGALQERIDDCAEHLTATRDRLRTIRARLRELKSVEQRDQAGAASTPANATSSARRGPARGTTGATARSGGGDKARAEAEATGSAALGEGRGGGDGGGGCGFSSGALSEPLTSTGTLDVHEDKIRMLADEAAQPAEDYAATALEREEKRRADKCIRAFNIHPSRGLGLMEELKLVDPWSARGLGELLCRTACLNKAKLGEFFGDAKTFNVEALRGFCDACAFKDMSFEAAIRLVLSKVVLPTESVKVDQIIQAFADSFCEQNPDTFTSPGVVHVLAFSVVMLNHDAHQKSGGKTLGKEQFVSNNKGIDQGKDLPRALLEELYDSVAGNEIRAPTERSEDGALFTNPVREGFLRKQGGIHMGWAKRWFILCDHTLYYFKDEADIDPKGFFPMENVVVSRSDSNDKQLELLPRVGAFLKSAKYDSSGQMVTGNHRKCLLRANSTEECTMWIAALNDANKDHVMSARDAW